jgi:catechol 2,3-dioxygenase-like lactoylglutathione lyase family enzyme
VNAPERNLFQRPHHICIVVDDLAAAIAYYQSLGVGPWKDFFAADDFVELSMPRADFESLEYRICSLDNIQLQLCQPGDADTPQRRFLDENGPGVYHIGFTVDDVNRAEAHGRDQGLSVLASGRRADRSGYTYFATRPQAGVTLEVRSLPDTPQEAGAGSDASR